MIWACFGRAPRYIFPNMTKNPSRHRSAYCVLDSRCFRDLDSAQATNFSRRERTMLTGRPKHWMLRVASAAIVMLSSFAANAAQPHAHANINLAVASNFYGVPPSNSAITDIIKAFEMANPGYTVTVVDNGATSTLEEHIINGNMLGVDLFLAADTATPLDLLTNHFNLVAPYNFRPSSPKFYIFNYA